MRVGRGYILNKLRDAFPAWGPVCVRVRACVYPSVCDVHAKPMSAYFSVKWALDSCTLHTNMWIRFTQEMGL